MKFRQKDRQPCSTQNITKTKCGLLFHSKQLKESTLKQMRFFGLCSLNDNIAVKKSFSAFTLAEVLITLGIIGVVAAMTIPTLLVDKAKTETATKIKKSYSMIFQAIKLSELENGSNDSWDWGTETLTVRESFDKYWAPYLKTIKYCDSYSDCGYSTSTPWVQPNGSNTGVVIEDVASRTSVLLPDGSLLMVRATSGGTVIKDIFIDINAGLSPNKMGRDVFKLYIDSHRGLFPAGYGNPTSTIISNCSSSGMYCLQKIISDGWEIKDDYPW